MAAHSVGFAEPKERKGGGRWENFTVRPQDSSTQEENDTEKGVQYFTFSIIGPNWFKSCLTFKLPSATV